MRVKDSWVPHFVRPHPDGYLVTSQQEATAAGVDLYRICMALFSEFGFGGHPDALAWANRAKLHEPGHAKGDPLLNTKGGHIGVYSDERGFPMVSFYEPRGDRTWGQKAQIARGPGDDMHEDDKRWAMWCDVMSMASRLFGQE